MIVYPNAKINIGLNIVERRTDGYHNISTLFYPVKELKDILEITIDDSPREPLTFTQTGIQLDCAPENNLCIKAYHLINNIHPLPPIRMHLHKLIPTGAGLGGGSADGAFALKAINELAGNFLDNEQLIDLALKLGSDCPFFIINSPCIGSGRGEILEPFELSLTGCYILLINPGIHINTGKAYMQSTPKPWETNLETLLKTDIANWPNNIKNDFEEAVFSQHTEIASIKKWMYEQGATYAAMSGSGSTVYGIFKTIPVIDNRISNYFSKIVLL